MLGRLNASDPRRYRSPGGYTGLVKTAVATGDLGILAPLSVKDAIWIDVERALRAKDDWEYKKTQMEYLGRRFDDLHLALLDNREVARSTNYFAQIAALKESKRAKFTYYESDNLPSVIAEKRREKEEASRKALEERKRRADRLAEIRRQEAAEESLLVKRMWTHMKRVEAAEKQFGSAYKAADTNGAEKKTE